MTVARSLARNGTFQSSLAFGQVVESLIAKWLIAKECMVLPIYEIEDDKWKGPRVFGAKLEAVAPDMLVFRGKGSLFWCEAKRKTRFAWYRKEQRWQTGIDLNHWKHYQGIAVATGIPVWLFFLHECPKPTQADLDGGSDDKCPTGLFGNTLEKLSADDSSQTWCPPGSKGMIYWARRSLLQLDTLENFMKIAQQ